MSRRFNHVKMFPDLNQYPGMRLNTPSQLIIGDLHGNIVLLLHILIVYNTAIINRNIHAELLRLLSINENPTYTQIQRILYILRSEVIFTRGPKILFLGDILADRGHNDYFMLVCLEQLAKIVDYEILISNHDLEFIYMAETDFIFLPRVRPSREFTLILPDGDQIHNGMNHGSCVRSLKTLHSLIKKGESWSQQIKEETMAIYQNIYKPRLRLVSSIMLSTGNSLPKLMIFVHACVGLSTIKELTGQINSFLPGDQQIIGEFDTPENVCLTISRLNQGFSSFLKEKDWFTRLVNPDQPDNTLYISPFIRICWERNWYDFTNNPKSKDKMYDCLFESSLGSNMILCHGHDYDEQLEHFFQGRVYNLDHCCGRNLMLPCRGECLPLLEIL